jgi:hypothetical protein
MPRRSALTRARHTPCVLCSKQPSAPNGSSITRTTTPAPATQPALPLALRAPGERTWAPQQQEEEAEGVVGSGGVLLLGLPCQSWQIWSSGWLKGGAASTPDCALRLLMSSCWLLQTLGLLQ